MKRHVDKHLVGAIAVCAVITATLAFSAVLLKQPTPSAVAAEKTINVPIVADGDLSAWTSVPESSDHYANVDEGQKCDDADFNYTLTPYSVSNPDASSDSYLVDLSAIPKPVVQMDVTGKEVLSTAVIKKIEIMPCVGAVVRPGMTPNSKIANPVVEMYYKVTSDNAKNIVSAVKQYTLTSLVSSFQPSASWSTGYARQANTTLQVAFRLKSGSMGVKVAAARVAVTYEIVAFPVPPAPVVLVPSSFGPAAATIAHGTTGAPFLDLQLYTTKSLQINALRFQIHRIAGDTSCLIRGSKGTKYFQNIRIANLKTNQVYMGPEELPFAVVNSSTDSGVITLTDSFTIPDHTTTTVRFMADVSLSQDAPKELYNPPCAYQWDIKPFELGDVRLLETSTDLPLNQISPNEPILGKSMSIK